MAQPEQFINWLTNQPIALANAINSIFGGSGANHSAGLVPDPGSTPGTSRFLREDSSWQAPTAQNFNVSALTPNSNLAPNSSPYTVLSTDYMRQIISFNTALTVSLPNTLPSGFICFFARITNNLTLTPTGGALLLFNNGTTASSITFTSDRTTCFIYFDGGNFWVYALNNPPTYTTLTTGTSQTYTPPTGCVRIKVRMVGGGGSAGGSSGVGTAGGNTVFGSWTAIGGGGSGSGTTGGTNGQQGSGGTGGATGTGTQIRRTPGSQGGLWATTSGLGGGTVLGPPTPGVTNSSTGVTGATNSGAGGSGGSVAGTVATAGAGGGEYVEFFVSNPSATTYSVGTAGTPGTSGGTGAAGIILIEEFYY